MKSFFTMSPRHQKWGLFLLLAGSLGFNLSMNPEHFNNITRHDGTLHSMDLAQTAPPAKADDAEDKEKKDAEAKPDAKKDDANKPAEAAKPAEPTKATEAAAKGIVAPGEEKKPTSALVIVRGTKGEVFKAKVVERDQVSYFKLEMVGGVEGRTCQICNEEKPLTSSINVVKDLKEEIEGIISGKITVAESDDKKPAKKVAEKKGEALEADLEEWAKPCDKVADEGKLECHKNRLIELSKYLKNSSATEKFLRTYFKDHLERELKRGLTAKTVSDRSSDSCSDLDGQVLYATRANRVACMSSKALDDSNEMAEQIINGLRAGNSKLVVSDIAKLRASSVLAQLSNSQQMAREGSQLMEEAKNQGDMTMFNIGMAKKKIGNMGMDPMAQSDLLNDANSNMLDSIQQMSGSAAQKSTLEDVITGSFYTPVGSVLNQMRRYVSMGNPNDPNNRNQPRTLEDFNIPYAGNDLSVPGNPNADYQSGLPGNIPTALWAGRLQPYRGASLQPIGMNTNWLGTKVNFLTNTTTGIPNWNQTPTTSSITPTSSVLTPNALSQARTARSR